MVWKEAFELEKMKVINKEELLSMLQSNDYNNEDIEFLNKLMISAICTGIIINVLEKSFK